MSQRELEYVGGCQREFDDFPEDVRDQAAFALFLAQEGEKHPDAVPMKGFPGASVVEVRLPYQTDAYRVIYTTRFAEVVYVLCAFKKKSTHGVATPQRHLDLIRHRLATAVALYRQRTKT